MKTFIKRCSKNRGESLNFDSIQDNIFSVIVICHNHIDRYIYFVAAKESVESTRPSVIVVSHTPNQLIKNRGGVVQRLCGTYRGNSFQKYIFTLFAGASGVRGMFEFDKWLFSRGGKVAAILLGGGIDSKPVKISEDESHCKYTSRLVSLLTLSSALCHHRHNIYLPKFQIAIPDTECVIPNNKYTITTIIPKPKWQNVH